MHARAVTCRMCKSKFFPASLKFHTKVCAEKQDHIDLPCDYCQKKFPPTVLQTHMKICKRDSGRAQTTRGTSTGRRYQDPMVGKRSVGGNYNAPARAFSARRHQQRLPVATTPPRASKMCNPLLRSHASDVEPGPQSVDGSEHCCAFEESGEDEVVTSSNGRVACSNCNRWFSPERVGVHQDICERVNTEENRRRHRTTSKGVGSNCVRSATLWPNRSASGYSAGRRRRAQELLQPGREHNPTHRAIDGRERLIMTATYSAPRTTTGQGRGAASTEPRTSRIHLVEMKKRESGHHRWSQTENRRPVGTPRAACRDVGQRARPSSAAGWVSSTAKPAAGNREVSTARALSSTGSPVRLDRGDSVTVRSTRGVRRAARCMGGNGGGDDGGNQSAGRRHNAVRDAFPRRGIAAMSEVGGVCERARYYVPPQTAFFAPPGARRKIPSL